MKSQDKPLCPKDSTDLTPYVAGDRRYYKCRECGHRIGADGTPLERERF